MTRYYTINGQILGQRDSSGNYSGYMQDALGSVTGTTDGSGNLENTYRWAGYGTQIAKTGTADDPKFLWNGTLGCRQTGRPHSGVYVRARHYGIEQAGWTTVDALWLLSGPYGYAMQRPLTFSDPAGLQAAPSLSYNTICCQNPVPGEACNPMEHQWWVRWVLGGGTGFNGWVIQLIQWSNGSYTNCSTGAQTSLTEAPFLEAWQVVNGQICLGLTCSPSKADVPCGLIFSNCQAADFWNFGSPPSNPSLYNCTTGQLTVSGTAKLFSEADIKAGNGPNPAGTPKIGSQAALPAWTVSGCLPTLTQGVDKSFPTELQLFNANPGTSHSTRTWNLSWNCCPPSQTSSGPCPTPKTQLCGQCTNIT